jgi:hypothetical protein
MSNSSLTPPTFHLFPRFPDELKVHIITSAWEAALDASDTKDKVTVKFVKISTSFKARCTHLRCPQLHHVDKLFGTEILRLAANKFITSLCPGARLWTNHLVSFSPNAYILTFLNLQDIGTLSQLVLKSYIYDVPDKLRNNLKEIRIMSQSAGFQRLVPREGIINLFFRHFPVNDACEHMYYSRLRPRAGTHLWE